MSELSTRYNPKETEDKWYKFWEEKGFFHAKVTATGKKPFCIVIPPPNVTGILHMGHALNNSIQDILIRYHRMKGFESCWMPGTDHAGIATQNVVEKSLVKEKLKRQDLGRDKFIERVWAWKEQYGSTIIRQLRKLGSSCDWERLRFTMDSDYSNAVTEVFVRLFEKGLIYQGNYIINWCPRCQTALSDEEAPHHELASNLYYLRYPLKEDPDEYLVVATTRPETMLGDTAVAVNPKDKRFKRFLGKTLILPLVNREIKVIADSMVDTKFGTGAVKVTPAHDSNDYSLGKKHNLEFINVMHPDARMNENAGDYKDMDRFEAREVILEDLKEKGLLEKVEPHKLSAGHCYRCHTIIEPYLSKQWFVRMKPLSLPAIEAVKNGKIKFHPARWKKVYLNWMENIQDWCISRQIWWGHRIPVYYCEKCYESQRHPLDFAKGKQVTPSTWFDFAHHKSFRAGTSQDKTEEKKDTVLQNDNQGIFVSRRKIEKCLDCGSTGIFQDEDVLDTWFSSWLWPFAIFYWPFYKRSAISSQTSDKESLTTENRQLKADLEYFYPTSVLVTAPEIIFFWVARMIMAGMEFMQDIPFKDVYIHGTVRDIEGKKMSKSLGNIIDPLDIINEYGTDALRFSLISITAQGQDVYLSKERFEQGRNFANKIWNASRFILMNLDASLVKTDLCVFFANNKELNTVNRWILSRFYSTLKKVNSALDKFQFNEAANMLYSFFWHDFCDWYLEIIKPDIKLAPNQVVMYKILEKYLRVLHPFMPFITEEIWQKLNPEGSSIMTQSWPHVQEQIINKKLENDAYLVFNIVTQIRNLRAQIGIKPDQLVITSIFPHKKARLNLIKENSSLIKNLAKLETIHLLDSSSRPTAAISTMVEDIDIYLHITGLLDIENEKAKLEKKITEINTSLHAKETRLKNSEFVKKAPVEIVEKEKTSIEELKNSVVRLKKMLNELR